MKVFTNPGTPKPFIRVLQYVRKIQNTFFWYSMFNQVIAYLRLCEYYQSKQGLSTTVKSDIHVVLVFPNIM